MFGKKERTPIKKGVARVPVVMQMEALECGAASLTMIMHYYRKWIPLEQARVDCGVSMDGFPVLFTGGLIILWCSAGFEEAKRS